MPTTGRKTTRVSPQESNQSIDFVSLRQCPSHRREAEEPHADEEHQRVELQTSGLQLAGRFTDLAGADGDSVDRAVDSLLIDVLHT